jgi:hypothetical protein
MATPFEIAVEKLRVVAEAMQQAEQARAADPLLQAQIAQQSGMQALQEQARLYAQAETLRQQAAVLATPQGARMQQQQFAVRQQVAARQAQVQILQAPGVAQLQGQQGLLNAQVRAAQVQAQAAHTATPRGQMQQQATAQAQAQAGSGQALLSAQQQAAALQAQAAHLKTPQGQVQYQGQLQAQQQAAHAQTQIAQQQNIASYGKLGGAIINAFQGFEKLNPAIATARQAMAAMLYYGAKASPTTAATYQSSKDLLEAQVGRFFLPAIDQMSAAMQHAAKEFDQMPDVVRNALRNSFSGMLQSSFGHEERRAREAAEGKPRSRLSRWTFGQFDWIDEGKPKMARSLQGMPEPGMGTAEQYQQRLQMAALEQGEDSPEAKLLRIQLDELKELGGILTQIQLNTAEGGSFR